jgi:CheY-like chemotaxis protein
MRSIHLVRSAISAARCSRPSTIRSRKGRTTSRGFWSPRRRLSSPRSARAAGEPRISAIEVEDGQAAVDLLALRSFDLLLLDMDLPLMTALT